MLVKFRKVYRIYAKENNIQKFKSWYHWASDHFVIWNLFSGVPKEL